MPTAAPVTGADLPSGWDVLTRSVARQAPALCGPAPGAHGVCGICRCPVPARLSRCYQCTEHAESLPGLTADAVVPVCYAPKGGPHARNLWLYKSSRPGAAAARADLLALLAVFLRDHGTVRLAQRRDDRTIAPGGGAQRPGPPRPASAAGPGRAPAGPARGPRSGSGYRATRLARDADPGRFSAAGLDGAAVALLDDTWTSGASAQSAAAALRLAGARSVAVMVLGRHLPARGPAGPAARAAVPAGPCAVHTSPAPGQ